MHCKHVCWLSTRGEIQNVPAGGYAVIVRMSALRYTDRVPLVEFRASCTRESTELNFDIKPTTRQDEPSSDVAFAATYVEGGRALCSQGPNNGALCSILVGALQVCFGWRITSASVFKSSLLLGIL